jgi:hypothetical protein
MVHCLFFYSHRVWSVPLFVVPLRFCWYLFVSTGPTQWPRILAVVLLMSNSMFLRRKAVVLFAFLVMMSIWLFHDSVLSMVTPRYFALLVSCNGWYIWHLWSFSCLWFWLHAIVCIVYFKEINVRKGTIKSIYSIWWRNFRCILINFAVYYARVCKENLHIQQNFRNFCVSFQA